MGSVIDSSPEANVTAAAEVTVVVACHTEDRWTQLCDAVDSVTQQVPAPKDVVVVVDHNERLLGRARRDLPHIIVLENEGARGASGARNTGARRAQTRFVAFLDDDAVARPGWLAGLLAPLESSSVVGSGGVALPRWERAAPRWFPVEFSWVVGATHFEVANAGTSVRNVWAENMAVRRSVFNAVGGFREGFGKLGEVSRPEDTDLCVRMSSGGAGTWAFVPEAVIDHFVPASRSTFGFFVRRCFAEGAGKAEMAAELSTDDALDDEWGYILRTVPRAIRNRLVGSGRGRAELGQVGAILIGVFSAALGFLTAKARRLSRGRS